MKDYPKEDYPQVCVWPATVVGRDNIEEFERFITDQFSGVRVKYIEEIITKPDQNGSGGGRNDVIFAVHTEDIMKFAIPRLKIGIKWVEDVLDNEAKRTPGYSIYPEHLVEYRTW